MQYVWATRHSSAKNKWKRQTPQNRLLINFSVQCCCWLSRQEKKKHMSSTVSYMYVYSIFYTTDHPCRTKSFYFINWQHEMCLSSKALYFMKFSQLQVNLPNQCQCQNYVQPKGSWLKPKTPKDWINTKMEENKVNESL